MKVTSNSHSSRLSRSINAFGAFGLLFNRIAVPAPQHTADSLLVLRGDRYAERLWQRGFQGLTHTLSQPRHRDNVSFQKVMENALFCQRTVSLPTWPPTQKRRPPLPQVKNNRVGLSSLIVCHSPAV